MRERFLRHKPLLVFFLCYTLLFLIVAQAALFVLPFIISLIFAVVMKPLFDFLRRKFSFRSSFAATALTMLIYLLFFAVIGFLFYLIALQAISLFETYGYLIEDFFSSPELFENLRGELISGNLLSTLSGIAVSLFQIVPLIITFAIITFAMTVFYLNRMGHIKRYLLQKAGRGYREKLTKTIDTAYTMVRRFIRSYLILYCITFVEAVFIFYLTGIPYPLPFAFVTAVADILPVLGPGTVYLPFSIIYIVQGRYLQGITLIVYFLLTVILRQILEPKIVSDTVKVHPLVIMSGIYFSIVSMNIWVLFYVVLLFLIYKVLKSADVFSGEG